MRLRVLVQLLVLVTLGIPRPTLAGLIKTYLPEFTVIAPERKEELKTVLHGLLASRLNPEHVQLVDSEAKADLVIAGSYAMFGKVFSVDALLKSKDGSMVKLYEQGKGEDDLIPALGRLAQKIDKEMAKRGVTPAASSEERTTQIVPAKPLPAPPAGSYQLMPQTSGKSVANGWSSPPLEGVFVGIAVGRRMPSGERELFLAGNGFIRYYLQGAQLKQVAEVEIGKTAKILGIDAADLDGDGVPELYVTIMDRETLASRVYIPREGGLEKLAEGLPYFFRGIGHGDKDRKVLVQEMGVTGEFYGDVAELVKIGGKFETRNPQKLSRNGNLYNSNFLSDAEGKRCTLVMNDDGYLMVISQDGKMLWQSSEKFGGSDKYYKRETLEEKRFSADQYRWFFLEQRMVVTPGGEILVPKNDGFLVVGNLRSYKKHSFYAFRWTGAILEEKWHTKESPTYLADFAYDSGSNELVELEVTQNESMFDKGKSVITINRIE